MTIRELTTRFLVERSRFAASYPRVEIVYVEVRPKPRRAAFRDFAYYDHRRRCIVVYRALLGMPRENIVAVLRHELGHAVDPLASEAEADRIAERVTGRRIRYDADNVQTIGRGGPRPRHLHR